MEIKIKRFDKELPLPKHQTDGAAAFDLVARETVTIGPGELGYIPLNVAVETPPDHFFLLAARGGTHKRGLMPANGIGIVDPDFCGNGDEVKSVYFNFSKEPVTVERGERIAQGMFIKVSRGDWEEVEIMESKTRGGFGSTGNK